MTAIVRLSQRWFSLVAIIVLLATFARPTTPMLAQEPAVTPTKTEEAPAAQFEGVIYDPAKDPVPARPGTEAVTPEAEESAAPANEAALPELVLSNRAVQGTIALSISVQPVVRHSEYITYAFSYKNTGNTATTSLSLDTIWNNFRYSEDGGAWQYCPAPTTDVPGCGFITATAFGPAITAFGNITGGVRYNIASLAPGQSGGFRIRLIISKNIFPKSNQDITRPSASGKVYLNGEIAPSSELTVSSLVVGPPLRVDKTLTADLLLYPLESAPFTITVGNATGTGDIISGQMRADATPATNVIVKDTFPLGSQLISAEGNPTVTGNVLTWVIPLLNPGETRKYKVVFKKLDGVDCGKLHNATISVTSNELPFYSGIRYVVPGNEAAYPVITPLIIKSITKTPNEVVYGGESVIKIVVQSFWDQPINGATLQFKLQANTYYVTATANPILVSEPPANQFGSTVNWTFNMPAAGSRISGVEKSFSLKVRSGYFDIDSTQWGQVTVTPPGSVPNLCAPKLPVLLELLPRVTISMGTDAPDSTKIGQTYIVQRGQNFPYVLHLVNNSNQNIVLNKVWIKMPAETEANFTYVVGSSKVNGVVQAPNTIQNGNGGKLEWLNIPIAANSQTIIRYSLMVQGRDYYTYCSYIYATLGTETVGYTQPIYICVKINPQVELTKTVNKLQAQPGEEVIFTISLTNREDVTYQLGLYDRLESFDWISQVSGYGTPTYNAGTHIVRWPLVSVAPDQTISAAFKVRLPGDVNSCVAGTYVNQVLFFNSTDDIQPNPAVVASVQVTCRQIEYSQAVERYPVSLQDKFTYLLQVVNKDSTGPSNTVAITNVLPVGFTYVGIDPTSPISLVPSQSTSNGRVQLNWSLPPIDANTAAQIRIIARSGKSIGIYENWLLAQAAGEISLCAGSCDLRTYKTITNTFSLTSMDVQPMITVEPSITPTTCVLPNSTVSYKVTVLNTNSHSYPRTTVAVSLPLGLKYVSPIGTTPVPNAIFTADGMNVLTWTGINIPAKPNNAFGSQVALEFTIKVGNVWGTVNTGFEATSSAGLIPRKDGVIDSTVKICPQQPSLAKTIVQKVPKIGDLVTYQLSIANPNNTALTATVQDILPNNISFVGMLAGSAPTQSGNTLTWNLTVPAATTQIGSVTILKFTARVNSGTVFQKYINTATITQSSVPFITSINGVPINSDSFTIGKPHFIPLLQR